MARANDTLVNLHTVAVFADNDRKIEPGQPIPDDVTPEIRKILLDTGFFGTPAQVAGAD